MRQIKSQQHAMGGARLYSRILSAVIALCALCVTAIASAATDNPPLADIETYNKSCGICHLENGEGVPAAYPPLDARLGQWSTSDKGSQYLVGVVANGLHGVIEVNGQRYVGSMPGMSSQLSSQQIAALLNFVVVNFGAGQAAFTTDSIEDIRQQINGITSLSLRPQ